MQFKIEKLNYEKVKKVGSLLSGVWWQVSQ